MTVFLSIYLIIINLITLFLMFSDKRRAIRHEWRVPEKTIFTLSFFGGAAGALVGMFLFRHKTRHLSFRILLPAFLIVNVAVIYWLLMGELI